MGKKDRMDVIIPYSKVTPTEHTHIYNDNALLTSLVTMLRGIDTSSEEFKSLIRTITRVMAFSVFADMRLDEIVVETPICKTLAQRMSRKGIVLIPILRAGAPMEEALVELLPYAQHGRCGLSRNEETFIPTMYLWEMPDGIEDMDVYLLDPMLATGNSFNTALGKLKSIGCKGKITVVAVLGAPNGLGLLQEHHSDVEIYLAHLDEGLNRHGYIVPGLGDAGDRLYGPKNSPF